MECVQVIPDFIVHSDQADAYLTYYLSFLVHVQNESRLHADPKDTRFVLIRDITVILHYGTVTSIEWHVKFGQRRRLPRIIHN